MKQEKTSTKSKKLGIQHSHTMVELRMIAMDMIKGQQQKCNYMTYGDLISIANFMSVWAQTHLVQIALTEQWGDEQMREHLSKIDTKGLPGM